MLLLKLLLNPIDLRHVLLGEPGELGDVDQLHDWVGEGLNVVATTHGRTVKRIYWGTEGGALEAILTLSLVLFIAVHVFHGQTEI
jgi:hypothetical protein